MTSKSASLRRWERYLSEKCAYPEVVSQFLDNQSRYCSELDSAVQRALAQHIGAEWREVILRASARVLSHDMLMELVGVQPQSAIQGAVSFLKAQPDRAPGDHQALDMDTASVSAGMDWCQTRASKTDMSKLDLPPKLAANLPKGEAKVLRIAASAPLLDRYGMAYATSMVATVLSAALAHVRKGLVQQIVLNATTIEGNGVTGDRARQLLEAVHKASGRAPANRLYGVKKHWAYVEELAARASYHVDPDFVPYQMLALYRGLSQTDAALIWAPVCFVFKCVTGTHRVDGEVRQRQVVDVGLCHGHHLARPDLAALVNV